MLETPEALAHGAMQSVGRFMASSAVAAAAAAAGPPSQADEQRLFLLELQQDMEQSLTKSRQHDRRLPIA
jgi:hypothetical protein